MQRRTFIGTTLAALTASAIPMRVGAHVMSSYKLYDTHAHFYTNDFAKYPVDGTTNRNGVEELRARVQSNPKTPEVIFKSWDEGNVGKGAAVQYGSAYLYDNRYILDISRQHPDRITPIVILDENDRKTPGVIEQMTLQNRISGIRFRGFAPDGERLHTFLSDDVAEIWQTANKLGIAIVLMPHTRTPEDRSLILARMAELAVRYPNVHLILDHMAFPQPMKGHRTFGFYPEHFELAKLDNVFYKYTNLLIEQLKSGGVSPAPFLDYSASIFGTNKMVWGSDYGNTPGRMVDLVQEAIDSAAGLPISDQRALFFDTADRIHVGGGRAAATSA